MLLTANADLGDASPSIPNPRGEAALGFFNSVRVLVAWCELRQDFRHFRLDRIEALAPTTDRYPRRRLTLLAQWRAMQAADRN